MSEELSEEVENKPVVAICYDFDKTLSPNDMQAWDFIPKIGMDAKAFWDASNERAKNNDMDINLSWMLKMKEESEGKEVFTKQKLINYGAGIELFPGVEAWFDKINAIGGREGIRIEHYIISSGLKEMIEGTVLGQRQCFKKIYASSFYYNEKDIAVWPAQVVNYTNKTQFLFRIEKGTLDVNDDKINEKFSLDKIRVPFRNIIYIGDSDTDIPCMKLVKSYGGYSIGVYNPKLEKDYMKTKVYKMIRDDRISFFAPADYNEGSPLYNLVENIICKTKYNEMLVKVHEENVYETENDYERKDERERLFDELLTELEGSGSYATTHSVVKKYSNENELFEKQWKTKDLNYLAKIVLDNNQISSILNDSDLTIFFRKMYNGYDGKNKDALAIINIIREE